MKAILLAFCGFVIFGVGDASSYTALELNPKCAAGPSFWCKNIKNAKTCGAMTHCIKTNSWQKYPVDSDSICKICLDMVAQARDQLRSNETQEELREVFEGTCAIIRIKKIREECDHLADAYEAQLVEMLTSQMDPQLVCSVAGLCNNAAIDAILAKTPSDLVLFNKPEKPKGLTCKQCGSVSDLIRKKFDQTNRDQFLDNVLDLCGRLSSFSDGCSAIVLSYFNEVYAHLKENLNADNICHMAGVCSAQFHQHEDQDDIEIVALSQIGVVDSKGDDLPCDLCEQLILHLRDLLVANTTETEFKNVLEGICKQTKSFKTECLSIADRYFDEIYNALTKELNPKTACYQIGICPKGLTQQQQTQVIAPLVPNKFLLEKKKLLGEDEPVYSAKEIQNFQLPKDVLLLNADEIHAHVIQQKGNQFCTLCEYFLHFVQDALASPKNEEAIKEAVLNSCHKLPINFQGQCQSFVNMYGDAVIALLIQDLDPSQICPRLNVCIRTTSNSNEKCPLCLFLVQDLVELIKRDKSKQNIEDKLNILCNRLRDDLKAECIDFVNTYTPELVDKLANDFTPHDICLYLKVCTEKEELLIEHIGSHSDYNDYMNNAISKTAYKIENENSLPDCLLCEQLIKEVEKKIANNKSKDHIKKVLKQACSTLPEARLRHKCITEIENNSDFIVDLIVKEVTPKEVCMAFGFCLGKDEPTKVIEIVESNTDNPPCRLCQIIVKKIEDTLNNKTAQEDVENCVKHVCLDFPKKMRSKCRQFIDKYAAEIIKHFPSSSPRKLCTDACICKPEDFEEEEEEPQKVVEIVESTTDNPPCHLCQIIVKKIEDTLNNKTAQEDVENCIKHVCLDFPKKMRSKCRQFIDEYAAEIIKHFPSSSPRKLCTDACICKPKDFEEEEEEPQKVVEIVESKTDNPPCRLCQIIVKKIEDTLNNKTAQEDVENCVKHVCLDFPKKMRSKCRQFIDEYAAEIIKHFPSSSPRKLCTDACICKPEDFEEDSPEEDVDETAPECLLCEELIHKVEQKVKNDKSREHIKDALEKACSSFRKESLKEKCVEIVDQKSDYIIDAIIKNTSPKEICHRLGFCDGTNAEQDKNIEMIADHFMTKYSETPQCVICELIMTKLENDLKKNATQDEIEKMVKRICSDFPTKLSGKCKKFVEDYADLIISMISTVSPHDLCGELNMCLSNSKKDTTKRDVLECGICLSAADALETVLRKNGPKDRLTVAGTTCNLLPAKYYESCHEFMTIYVESVTNLTKRGIEKSEICIQIGKCFRNGDNSMFVEIKRDATKSSEIDKSNESDESSESHEIETKRLVGASPCTHGPSYWCSSATAMKECNAHVFCTRRGSIP